MAKKSKTGDKKAPRARSATPAKASRPKISKAAAKAAEIASNPVVAEIVAATLVAAAAAIRDPKKARQIAAAGGQAVGDAAGAAQAQGGPLWQLALDVARRSVDALDPAPAGSGKKKSPKKTKKKKT